MADWDIKLERDIKQERDDYDMPHGLCLKEMPPPPAVVSSSTNSPPGTCMRPPPPPGPPRQRLLAPAYVEVKQERNGQEEPSSSIPDLGKSKEKRHAAAGTRG